MNYTTFAPPQNKDLCFFNRTYCNYGAKMLHLIFNLHTAAAIGADVDRKKNKAVAVSDDFERNAKEIGISGL